jgi:hypothetical protein
MTKEDYARMQQNLQLPPHTPLSTQIELLKTDMTRLLGEIMRLKNDLHAANQAQVGLLEELQATADASYQAGASAMRQAILDACCVNCTAAVIQLSNERPLQ